MPNHWVVENVLVISSVEHVISEAGRGRQAIGRTTSYLPVGCCRSRGLKPAGYTRPRVVPLPSRIHRRGHYGHIRSDHRLTPILCMAPLPHVPGGALGCVRVFTEGRPPDTRYNGGTCEDRCRMAPTGEHVLSGRRSMEIDVQVQEDRVIVKPVGRVDSTRRRSFSTACWGRSTCMSRPWNWIAPRYRISVVPGSASLP